MQRLPDKPPAGPQRPGKGLLGWLGRQVGYVKHAVKTDAKVVYRENQVEEAPHPTDPNLKLRRTVIDEVIVDKPADSAHRNTGERPAE